MHIFDGCTDIRLNDMIGEKFDIATRQTSEYIKTDLNASEKSSLIQVICQKNYIKSLGIRELDFDGITMPNYNQEEALKLAKTCNEPTEPEKKGFKKITRRIEDETEIIEKLKNPIAENGEFFTDIPLHQQKEIKDKVISDVFHLLFGCTETCPLCDVPFDEIHLGQLDLDSQHCSRCHRPTGFARYTPNKGDTFITSTCNDFVQSDHTFQNADTNYEFVHYKDH